MENRTTEQELETMLQRYGMSENQAKSVMQDFKPAMDNETAKEYNITWQRPANEYDDIMYLLWFQQLKVYALNWLNENCPEAWFKDMFK